MRFFDEATSPLVPGSVEQRESHRDSLAFPILASLPLLSLSCHTSAPRRPPPFRLHHTSPGCFFPAGRRQGKNKQCQVSIEKRSLLLCIVAARRREKSSGGEGRGRGRKGRRRRKTGGQNGRGKNGKEAREEKHVAAATSTFLGRGSAFPAGTILRRLSSNTIEPRRVP
ncbi:hypothetical protein K0M31_010201, partial [Melipona bicolor]